ncbi:MAG: hypothetical protein D6755_02400, partial [Anaerolineae bacterium]
MNPGAITAIGYFFVIKPLVFPRAIPRFPLTRVSIAIVQQMGEHAHLIPKLIDVLSMRIPCRVAFLYSKHILQLEFGAQIALAYGKGIQILWPGRRGKTTNF